MSYTILGVHNHCLEAVNMLKSDWSNLSKYSFIIWKIKQSMRERDSSITHICHNGNCASHAMANFRRAQGPTMVYLRSGPHDVVNIVMHDCNP